MVFQPVILVCGWLGFHSPSWQVFQGIAQQHEAQREGAEIDMEESDISPERGRRGVAQKLGQSKCEFMGQNMASL